MSGRSQCGGIQKTGDSHVTQDHFGACRSDGRSYRGNPNGGLGALARWLASLSPSPLRRKRALRRAVLRLLPTLLPEEALGSDPLGLATAARPGLRLVLCNLKPRPACRAPG